MIRIGIDVGGTNTDAVLIQGEKILGSFKSPTTSGVTDGVTTAVRGLLQVVTGNHLADITSQQLSSKISQVNVGTTHFINAVLQRRGLQQVNVLRLCGPAGRNLPPCQDWPEELAKKVLGHTCFAAGGYNYDGTCISELQQHQVEEFARKCALQAAESGRRPNFAIVGCFSSVRPDQELLAAEWILRTCPRARLTLSHEIGQLGYLQRENATILNASLKSLARRTVNSLSAGLSAAGLPVSSECPLYLTQNDGTLLNVAACMRLPVRTFSSGATNSMRGAAFLCDGIRDALVADIGGTSTDVGLLQRGFPKPASSRVRIGGVLTNFNMPEVVSIALGGGSKVRYMENENKVIIGPESVGYKLTEEAMVFGGHQLTLTDIAVAGGHDGTYEVGNASFVESLSLDVIKAAQTQILSSLEEVLDRARVSKSPLPVILVGGGALVVPKLHQDDAKLLLCDGQLEVLRPAHAEVANAVGAALAQISGTVDRVVDFTGISRDDVIKSLQEEANQQAIHRGADPRTLELVSLTDVNLAYIPGNKSRVCVTVVGDLQASAALQEDAVTEDQDSDEEEEMENESARPESERTVAASEPQVDDGVWTLSQYDVECMALGAGVLGCGGGGNPYLGKLTVLNALKKVGTQYASLPRVVTPEMAANTSKEDQKFYIPAMMGSPTILVEKMPSARETRAAVAFLSKTPAQTDTDDEITIEMSELGDQPLKNDGIAGVVCAEIGGLNSMEPIVTAMELDCPLVDCDGMGRAFPELQMFLPFIEGMSPSPASLANEFGRGMIRLNSKTAKDLENYFRVACVGMGCSVGVALGELNRKQLESHTVHNTLSLTRRIGHVILEARKHKKLASEEICRLLNGTELIQGKITDLDRRTEAGFARGYLLIVDSNSGSNQVRVDFQNEFLLARRLKVTEDDRGNQEILGCTPDLLTLLDEDSCEPIPTEEIRYGLRVRLLLLPAAPELTTPHALQVVGPAAFGYPDVKYTRCAAYNSVPSICEQPK